MLAEVTIVSVIVTTVLITLFTGLNSVSSAYETRDRYYDVEALYIAMEVNDILKRDAVVLNDATFGNLNTYNVVFASSSIATSDIQNYLKVYSDNNYKYNIRVYFAKNAKDNLVNVSGGNKTLGDFLDYLKKRLDFDDSLYKYIIIVEKENKSDKNDCYYYALRLKY